MEVCTMSSRLHRRAAVAALAGLLAGTAQAAPLQLSFTASFSTCSGANCTVAIAQSLWSSVSGSFIYDPSLSSGWVAPPNGYAPDYFSTNRVHTFSGTPAFSATLNAGSLVARSTGIAFSAAAVAHHAPIPPETARRNSHHPRCLTTFPRPVLAREASRPLRPWMEGRRHRDPFGAIGFRSNKC
jgi:hypothetical protein